MSSAGESVELPEIRRDEKNTSTNEITRFHERNWTIRARKNFDLFYEVIAAERRIMKYTVSFHILFINLEIKCLNKMWLLRNLSKN